MILIPIGRIFRFIGELLADPRRSKGIFYLLVGACLWVIVGSILFVVAGTRLSAAQAGPLYFLICTSTPLVMLVAAVGVTVAAFQKSEPTSSATWLSVSEAAKYLQMTDAEVIGLIKSGKLLANKANGVYRLEVDMLNVFKATRNRGQN